MKLLRLIIVCCIVTLATACTSVDVKPVPPTIKLTNVCIERNEGIKDPELFDVIRSSIEKHGIATKAYNVIPPKNCNTILKYTGKKSWDVVSFLSHADLWLYDSSGKQIANATYHLVGAGGLTLSKFSSTKSKIEPLINKLLSK